MFCIAGADGFFGAYIQKYLISHGERVLALNHRQAVFPDSPLLENADFEVTLPEDIRHLAKRLRREDDVKMIYLIAAHAPDFVKENPEKAFFINSTAYRNFLSGLSGCPISTLYYSSSDTVYGENKTAESFCEDDALCPVNLYGEHKAEAERITLENGFSVARFSYMFAPSLTHKPHFFDSLTQKLRASEKIYMFTDYIRSSLPYPATADYLCRLIKADSDKKIFNICADEPTSKYDIGLYAARLSGADEKLVVPCLSTDTDVFTEKRAGTLTMSNKRLRSELGITERIGF